jgi:hypothetical protein
MCLAGPGERKYKPLGLVTGQIVCSPHGVSNADTREIRFRGTPRGTYTIDRLYRACMSGEFDGTAEFFSDRKKEWIHLVAILEDFYPSADKIQTLRAINISTVKILGTGTEGDCPACNALTTHVYPIDDVPTIPPADCCCVPWCGLVVVADR